MLISIQHSQGFQPGLHKNKPALVSAFLTEPDTVVLPQGVAIEFGVKLGDRFVKFP